MESQEWDEYSSSMKCKLGFEFQEGSGLCPWALENFNVQKKPLFYLIERESSKEIEDEPKGSPLWHVVLDTSDIEFVTIAFTDSKGLKRCVSTILASLQSLQELLKINEL